MDLKSTYNKIAKDWVTQSEKGTFWLEGVDKFISHVKSSGEILDLGCAGGAQSKYLTDKGFKVTGIDFSEEMIKLSKEKVPEGEFLIADINEPLPFENKFDGVLALAVVLHTPKNKIPDVLKNIIKTIKAKGYLYITVEETRAGEKDESTLKEKDFGYEHERFFSYFTLVEMRAFLEKLGMKIINENIHSAGSTKWIAIIAQK